MRAIKILLTTPIEVKSGNASEHASLDYFSKKYKKATNKPIVLTKPTN